MNTLSQTNSLSTKVQELHTHFSANKSLWLLFAGVGLMFIPTLWSLLAGNGLWTDDEHSHGPVILSISLWLLWTRWKETPSLETYKPAPALAWVCFIIAGALYIPGRALDII